MVYIHKIKTPIGDITLGSDGEALIGLWLDNQKYYLGTINEEVIEKDLPIFKKTEKWLTEYFKGHNPKIDIPLKPWGSKFRQDVFDILKEIPYGQVVTYGDIAKKLEKKYGHKMSAQAVGGAVGHNPISIIIPCHRVVGTNGSLTGYAGGIRKKIALLTLEKVNMENLFIPSKGTAL